MKFIFFCITLLILSSISNCYAQSETKDSINIQTLQNGFTPQLNFLEEEQRRILYEELKPAQPLDYSYSQWNTDLKIKKLKTNILNAPYTKFIIPSAMIGYGIVARVWEPSRKLDTSTNHEVGEHLKYKIPVDDYSQYAPIATVYGLDLLGVKAKHNFRDRTLIAATSYLIMGGTVQIMKSSIKVERPNRTNNNSFPSGHTATAFVGAHILFKEYKDVSPWIGIGGYAVATGTGTLRVLNKKHWVSDVVMGAGIGILSAEAGYLLLPVWHNILGIKQKENSLAIVPNINTKAYGVSMAYTFK